MCRISDFLTAKQLVDGTKYLAVGSVAIPQHSDDGKPFPQPGWTLIRSDGYESQFFPALTPDGEMPEHVPGRIVLYLATPELEWIWAAVAAGSQAQEVECAVENEVPEFAG